MNRAAKIIEEITEIVGRPVRLVNTLEDGWDDDNGATAIYEIVDEARNSLAGFFFFPMPGNCGMEVLSELWLSNPLRGQGIGTLLVELAEETVRSYGATIITGTYILDGSGKALTHILLNKRDWRQDYTFVNRRSSNHIAVVSKEL